MSSDTGFESGPDIDPSTANVARVYDYMLGGKDNFAADRLLGDQLMAAFPESSWIAKQNRAFVGRAVQFVAARGIDQFLDVGSGLPTMESVHAVARRVNQGAAVVYVENDLIALAHANALLATSDGVSAILGDVREPANILADVSDRGLIDLTRPFAVLLTAILHFITDDESPAEIVRAFADAMPSGSYLILSHGTYDVQPQESARASRMYRNASSPLVLRSKHEVAELLSGFELAEPGMVCTSQWRAPESAEMEDPTDLYAGVGRKP
jgi:hypothetical protein